MGGEAERAAVAMVSTGSGDIMEVREVGIICQGRGEVGVLQDALLSHPATARPLPVLPHTVTHPLISQSVSFLVFFSFFFFSGPSHWFSWSPTQVGKHVRIPGRR